MRKDVKSELQMLRELVWYLVGYKLLTCCFCNKPLLEIPADMLFGHRRHPKVDVELCLHHTNFDRKDNRFINLCHSSCHKSYHGKMKKQKALSDEHGARRFPLLTCSNAQQ